MQITFVAQLEYTSAIAFMGSVLRLYQNKNYNSKQILHTGPFNVQQEQKYYLSIMPPSHRPQVELIATH